MTTDFLDIRSAERASLARTKGNAYINVGVLERQTSLWGGGLMVLYGLTRGTTKGLLLAGVGAALAYRGATGHCDVYQALKMTSNTRRKSMPAIPSDQGVTIEESVTINQTPNVLYGFWRELENLPRVMRHLVSVEKLDEKVALGGQRPVW